ncbi:hypothetical protein GQ607_013289 [Colletotrichum asianum]|uniref:Uncharacterized protein n=1 Tax=Colletotrichum asianum TaxID=702518 RepID=A0A8H3W406_9PEZI|nr:hypothetical protein GQ607_013289 [Colletotrichum asianum]
MARQWRSLNSRLGPESVGSRCLFRWVARRMLPLHSHIPHSHAAVSFAPARHLQETAVHRPGTWDTADDFE